MKIEKVNLKDVPPTARSVAGRSPVTDCILGLTPRKAFRFTLKDKAELATVRNRVTAGAAYYERTVSTRSHGNDLYIFLRGKV